MTQSGLLAGLRVLDTTRFLAGPFGSMVLGDLGADIVKVEDPGGDSTRRLEPHFFEGDSAYFLSVNRNKRSIVLDLKSPEGREVLAELTRSSDVVLDNLRPDQRRQLGLHYDQLRAINPAVISCSLTGFGSSGPYVRRPAYDMVVQALSGVMSLTGEAGGIPVRTGVPLGDLVGGLNLVIGVLAALYQRAQTGEGEHIDIALLDGQIAMLSYLASYFLVSGEVPGLQGRSHDSIPTYNAFRAADDRDVVIAANTETMWRSLCRVLDVDHLTRDPRFATNADRLRHRRELEPLLAEAFRRYKSAELLERLTAAEVPCAPINTLDRALDDPQVLHREMVISVPHRGGGSFRAVGSPIKATGPSKPPAPPPGLGQHSVEILRGLGYDEEGVERLLASGHVGPT